MPVRPKASSASPLAENVPQKAFYSSLDALRGLAAFGVVFFHLANWTDTVQFFPRGDLAVDFFFCLSGFVVAHAYSGRIGKTLGFSEFVLTRLIRLYPLMALSVIVAATFFFSKLLLTGEDIAITDILIASISGLLVVPYLGETIVFSGPYEVFPINGPLWSLFFELAINFAWAAGFVFLTFRRTVGFAAICATFLLIGGLFHGDLLLGDRTTDFIWGVPRVGFSFAAGLVVYELHKRRVVSLKLPFWIIALVLILPLMISRGAGGTMGVLLDAIFIYIITPVTVLLAADIQQRGRSFDLSRIGGELSYPIYVLHFPIFAWTNGMVQFLAIPLPVWTLLIIHLVVIALASWLALIWFDRPVRRLLNSKRKKKVCATSRQLT